MVGGSTEELSKFHECIVDRQIDVGIVNLSPPLVIGKARIYLLRRELLHFGDGLQRLVGMAWICEGCEKVDENRVYGASGGRGQSTNTSPPVWEHGVTHGPLNKASSDVS